jgi:hypothetical protein
MFRLTLKSRATSHRLLLMIERLPLSDAEKAEAVRQLLSKGAE